MKVILSPSYVSQEVNFEQIKISFGLVLTLKLNIPAAPYLTICGGSFGKLFIFHDLFTYSGFNSGSSASVDSIYALFKIVRYFRY